MTPLPFASSDELGDLLRGLSSADEQAEYADLRHAFGNIGLLEVRREKLFAIKPKPNSQLAADNDATNPTQLGHLATYAQNVALDNLRSVRNLLDPQHDGTLVLPQTAMYPMIRSAIECSAQAVWLLAHPDSAERVLRVLQVKKGELDYDLSLYRMLTKSTDSDAREDRQVKAEQMRHVVKYRKAWLADLAKIAKAQNIVDSAYQDGPPGYGDMIAEAAAMIDAQPWVARGTWQMISGLTHPSSSRGASHSTLHHKGDRVGNTFTVRISANPRYVNHGLVIAMRFFVAAEDLIGDRSIRPASG